MLLPVSLQTYQIETFDEILHAVFQEEPYLLSHPSARYSRRLHWQIVLKCSYLVLFPSVPGNNRKRLSIIHIYYGKNTTAQGDALETLIKEIFNQIKGVRCTNDVKTKTNQFDCTALCGIKPVTLSVFSYLAPYFIIECKNEPKSKPNNTYCNKLLSIIDTNEAQIGIVFGRLDATEPCFIISREHYLTNKDKNKQQIIITCSDKDLKYLIDERVNLLSYLEYKIFQVTGNAPNSTYEMFLNQ